MNAYRKVKAPAPRPAYDGAKADLSHLAGMTPDQIIARMQADGRAESNVFRIVVLDEYKRYRTQKGKTKARKAQAAGASK